MALTSASIPTKNRILTTCVQLFLKKGYNGTTVIEILREAEVSASSFQNIFHNKEGVLLELVQSMFENQFGTARKIAGADTPPVLVYTVETAIQMALTELNENLRDIYLEAYTQPQCTEYIFQHTAAELKGIFGPYLPEAGESDFYELEIGSAGHHAGLHGPPLRRLLPPGAEAGALFADEPRRLPGAGGGAGPGRRLSEDPGHPRHRPAGDAAALPLPLHALSLPTGLTEKRRNPCEDENFSAFSCPCASA